MKQRFWLAPGVLLVARLFILLAFPQDGLLGYGDFIHFFRIANLTGWPYFQYWSEFPPLFPFLAEVLFRMAGGREHTFYYLLILALTLADFFSLYLFSKIAWRLFPGEGGGVRIGAYLVCVAVLAYSWWYFDPLAVLELLAGLYLILEERPIKAGFAIGLGILTKWFPVLLLPLAIKKLGWKKGLITGAVALCISAVVYGGLLLASPKFTLASLQAQTVKGSWETPWAMLDGNYATGNFGPEIERLDPQTASNTTRKPAVVSPWISLVIFGGLGLAAFFKLKIADDRQLASFGLLTFGLFFLWSPGWSPQWVLYLVPLILMALPLRTGLLLGGTLILANLMEWPVLLSRGMFWSLPLTIGIRTLLMVLLVVVGIQSALGRLSEEKP